MNELIIYVIKVALAISLFCLPYYLFMRNDANLFVKRFYLIGGITLAWIFPLLTLSKPQLTSSFEPTILIDPGALMQQAGTASIPQKTGFSLSGPFFILIIYLAGILFLFIKNIMAYIKSTSKKIVENSGMKHVVITNDDQVFTIFPNIFLPKKYTRKNDLNSILIHERAHIRQLHFIDLLISELTLILTWFNPFSWLISRMIKENHEHLADRSVLQQGVNPAHYKALLLNHAMGGEVFRLGHQFNHSLTKKRFKMMKNLKAPMKGFLKYLFIVPVILGFTLIATAASAQKTKTIHGTVYLEKKGEPATGASVIIYKTSMGTVVDKQGEFTLEADENSIITISFVGFETVRKSAKEIKAKPIILKPIDVLYTLEDPVSNKSKNDNVKIKLKSSDKNTNAPLYILDGEIVSSIDNVDPDQIDKIDVIKDPSDPIFKKYKSDSEIIQITTKKRKLQSEENSDKPIFFVVEDMPSFRGSKGALLEYLKVHTNYPRDKNGIPIKGEVQVKFKVNTKGKIENVEVKKTSNELLNDAAIAVIRDMPDWLPGKQRGKPVNVNVIVPVRFNTTQE